MPTNKFPDRPFLWPGARAHELPEGARMARVYDDETFDDFYQLDTFIRSKTHDPKDTYIVAWLPEWTPEPAPESEGMLHVEDVARALCRAAGLSRDWDALAAGVRDYYRTLARAALDTLRAQATATLPPAPCQCGPGVHPSCPSAVASALAREDPRVAVVRRYYDDADIGSSDDGIRDLLARLDAMGADA